MGDFNGLPANMGSTWIVSRLQGLFGLEYTIVSFTPRPVTLRASPSAATVDRDVPSGSITPIDEDIADSAGRVTALAMDV
jgi:hypothetical protein